MAITAAALADVYGALDTYVTALTLSDGTPLSVRVHGVRRFVPPTDAPWVEAHYDFLGLQAAFRNRTGQVVGVQTLGDRTSYAVERGGYLQLNLYQRARVFTTRYTVAAVRDAVVSAFPDGDMLDIPDSTTGAIAGRLIWDGVKEHVQDMGLLSGVVQHVIQIQVRYLEIFTRNV